MHLKFEMVYDLSDYLYEMAGFLSRAIYDNKELRNTMIHNVIKTLLFTICVNSSHFIWINA